MKKAITLVAVVLLSGCMAKFQGNVNPAHNTQMEWSKDNSYCKMEAQKYSVLMGTGGLGTLSADFRQFYKDCMIGEGWIEE